MNASKKKTRNKILLLLALIAAICFWQGYRMVFAPAISLPEGKNVYDFTIPTGASVNQIIEKLESETDLSSPLGLKILAKAAELENNIYPGLYTLSNDMSNKDLIILFRSAKRKSIKLRIGFGRFARDIIKSVAPKIEATEEELLALLGDSDYISNMGFSRYNIICLFLPDTYFFNWNTSAEKFFEKMLEEYVKFWNADRMAKVKELQKIYGENFNAKSIMTLASIIDQETNQNDEKDAIAGVYLNRLRIGMPLQADPTVKYALQDFDLKRIRSKHTAVNSSYNTYKNKGLPPGPICTASKAGIDAVLNYEKHKYLYFCAKPGYDGYHAFAPNFSEHLQNARKYQRWLNSEGY